MPAKNTETSSEEEARFDYIISGAGCAGLSFALHLIHSEKFKHKKILIVDKDAKSKNDRTWCFWEKKQNLFHSIVKKEWNQLLFKSAKASIDLAIQPYVYKLIRGIDFYNYCLSQIKTQPNITFLQATVERVFCTEKETGIIADGRKLVSKYVFNSILFEKPVLQKGDIWLLQHFKGWFINTKEALFDAGAATLMDFTTDQSNGTTFFYVLPFSPTSALVEYTLFSDRVLEDEHYETALEKYVRALANNIEYEISEKEFGIIPMTNYQFDRTQNNIIHLGTAGGQSKGSSGYTFKFIQKHSAALVQSLIKNDHPFDVVRSGKRFGFYDSVLLNILKNKTLEGADVFRDLFFKNKAAQVFKFLDNETSLPEEISIIKTLPTVPFLKAAIKQVQAGI